ncbi:tetratricopeptide repeat protein [Qipengyuania vesicularis]|uniref:tetratricopeptide repeat protein n=1 Tax=Qipengyuania vesicularis TaxID=2867232 RepID=UPI001C887D22|nr:tetratricopeptide repeat protein [Qipengyuania vesicularis]MBX7527893.1 hypothetical protein [Qipengyuania vesicularis]
MKFVSFWAVVIGIIGAATAWYLYSNSTTRAAQFAGEAESYRQAGNFPAAQASIMKAIAIRDDITAFHIMKGRISFQSGSTASAFGAYSDALALAPNNQEALLAVAQIGLQIGRLRQSRDATRRLLMTNPNFTEALLVRGLHSQIRRRYGEAIEDAEKILENNPRHEGGTILKVRASILSGKREEGREILEEFVANNPSTTTLAATELEVYRELRDEAGMARAFEKMRGFLPDNVPLRIDHANFLLKTGKSDEALEILSTDLAKPELRSRELTSIIQLIENYAVEERLLPHIDLIEAEGNEDARFEVAKLLVEGGQEQAAVRLTRNLPPNQVVAIRSLIAAENEQYQKALQLSEMVLEEDGSNCFLLYVRARAEIGLGQLRPAIRSAQQSASECPTLRYSWITLGRAYDGLEMPEQVERAFAQGTSANPQDPPIARAYAEWLEENGRDREAVAAYRRLVRAMPAHTPSWEAYLAICEEKDAGCDNIARQGLANSKTIFGIDPVPGERAPNGLFGRFLIR